MIKRKIQALVEKRIQSPETIVITGMRRVGKTSLLRSLFDMIPSHNKLFLDLENPLNQKYFEKLDYDAIIYELSSLGLTLKERAYLFLDEIQYLKTMPSVIKYLSDHYPIKFFLTGSASFYLKNLFTESLSGRKIIYELFPLDFEEFLLLKQERLVVPRDTSISESLHARFQTLYREYVEYGGFPGVVAKQSFQEKKELLSDIFTSYFEKEVLQLGDFRKNTTLRDLILLLFQRVGSRIEYQKPASELGISRITVKEYLSFLEQTYLFSLIHPYSKSRDREIRGMPKLYCIDSGLVNHFGAVDEGSLIENTIYHQLRVQSKYIHYFRKKTGAEIDFIVDKKVAYEVKRKASIHDMRTLQRLADGCGISNTTLVSYLYAPSIPVRYGFQL